MRRNQVQTQALTLTKCVQKSYQNMRSGHCTNSLNLVLRTWITLKSLTNRHSRSVFMYFAILPTGAFLCLIMIMMVVTGGRQWPISVLFTDPSQYPAISGFFISSTTTLTRQPNSQVQFGNLQLQETQFLFLFMFVSFLYNIFESLLRSLNSDCFVHSVI